MINFSDLNTNDALLWEHVGRLRGLAFDFDKIGKRSFPTDRDLASAPLIDNYALELVPRARLAGRVLGHPRLPDGFVTTSEVWIFAGVEGWARTYSRFYRLGNPHNSSEAR